MYETSNNQQSQRSMASHGLPFYNEAHTDQTSPSSQTDQSVQSNQSRQFNQSGEFKMGAHAGIPPMTVRVERFTMSHVFRMFAIAQDEPGRMVHVTWSALRCTFTLSVVFHLTTNEATWRLTIDRPGQSNAVIQRKTRNLTELYYAVLAEGYGC